MPRTRQRADIGRPSRLHAVIDTDDTGKPITVADRILEWIRSGHPAETAAARAGIGNGTFHHWLREAGKVAERVTINPTTRLSRHEQDLLVFSRNLEQARAEAEAKVWDTLHGVAHGGFEKTKRRIKVDPQRTGPDGRPLVIERETTVETTLPSDRALTWILTSRYGRGAPLEVRVEQGALDDQARAAELLEAVRGFVEDRRRELEQADVARDGVIDVRELPSNGNGTHRNGSNGSP